MKMWIKWILISIAAVVVALVVFVLILVNWRPSTEPITGAYRKAELLWQNDGNEDNKYRKIELQVDALTAVIDVTWVPTIGAYIQYPDEQESREIFPTELYFGSNELRYDAKSGIIYLMVLGQNPICSYGGRRIFEFNARTRKALRDYWVEVN